MAVTRASSFFGEKSSSTLRLFSLDLIVGSFDKLIFELTNWLIQLKSTKTSINQPLTIMVVSMQDVIANLFQPKVALAIKKFDILTMDGMPLVWLSRLLGYPAERMYGPEIMVALLAGTADLPVKHYFYGGTPELLEKLQKNLSSRWPNLKIAGMQAPPFRPLTSAEKLITIKQINSTKPDIIWVGLGSWKQLLWVSEFKSELHTKLIIPVGMAFDLLAGSKSQAPAWVRRSGGEWLFRLGSEPARLWSRYLWQVPFFAGWWLIELMTHWTRSYVARK